MDPRRCCWRISCWIPRWVWSEAFEDSAEALHTTIAPRIDTIAMSTPTRARKWSAGRAAPAGGGPVERSAVAVSVLMRSLNLSAPLPEWQGLTRWIRARGTARASRQAADASGSPSPTTEPSTEPTPSESASPSAGPSPSASSSPSLEPSGSPTPNLPPDAPTLRVGMSGPPPEPADPTDEMEIDKRHQVILVVSDGRVEFVFTRRRAPAGPTSTRTGRTRSRTRRTATSRSPGRSTGGATATSASCGGPSTSIQRACRSGCTGRPSARPEPSSSPASLLVHSLRTGAPSTGSGPLTPFLARGYHSRWPQGSSPRAAPTLLRDRVRPWGESFGRKGAGTHREHGNAGHDHGA